MQIGACASLPSLLALGATSASYKSVLLQLVMFGFGSHMNKFIVATAVYDMIHLRYCLQGRECTIVARSSIKA